MVEAFFDLAMALIILEFRNQELIRIQQEDQKELTGFSIDDTMSDINMDSESTKKNKE